MSKKAEFEKAWRTQKEKGKEDIEALEKTFLEMFTSGWNARDEALKVEIQLMQKAIDDKSEVGAVAAEAAVL